MMISANCACRLGDLRPVSAHTRHLHTGASAVGALIAGVFRLTTGGTRLRAARGHAQPGSHSGETGAEAMLGLVDIDDLDA